jgi:hypothetical protein
MIALIAACVNAISIFGASWSTEKARTATHLAEEKNLQILAEPKQPPRVYALGPGKRVFK